MTIEEKIFNRKKVNYQKLIAYGFTKQGNQYIYRTTIMAGQFKVEVIVKQGKISGKVFDTDTNEEYVLVHADGQYGQFVGQVKAKYQQVLEDIANKCFENQYFLTKQANQIAQDVEKSFNEQPDFPFKKFSNYGVFRNHLNNKWYGLIMNITKDKLTYNEKDAKQEVEILDVKVNTSEHDKLEKQPGFYPSYHMHKASWITILLDGTVSDTKIVDLLEKSRAITSDQQVMNSVWLVPGNPKYYDIARHFKVGETTIWKQSTKIKPGDMVYLYVTSPVKAVRYQCKVKEVDIPYADDNSNVKVQKIMKVKVLQEYDKDFCTFTKLKEFGIKVVRGPRRISKELVEYLNK